MTMSQKKNRSLCHPAVYGHRLMLLLLVLLAAILNNNCFAVASNFQKPQLSISLRDGSYDSLLDSFEPTLAWKHSMGVGGKQDTPDTNGSTLCDVDFGIETSVYPTTNIKTLPKSIWAKIATRIGDSWDLSGRAEKTQIQTNVQWQIDNNEYDVSARLSASKLKS